MLRVIVQEEAAALDLLTVELRHKLKVFVCLVLLAGHGPWIPFGIFEVLPRRVAGAHRRPYQEDWLLFSDELKSSLPFALDREVPRLSVQRVGRRDIQRQPRSQPVVGHALEHLGDSRRGVHL